MYDLIEGLARRHLVAAFPQDPGVELRHLWTLPVASATLREPTSLPLPGLVMRQKLPAAA